MKGGPHRGRFPGRDGGDLVFSGGVFHHRAIRGIGLGDQVHAGYMASVVLVVNPLIVHVGCGAVGAIVLSREGFQDGHLRVVVEIDGSIVLLLF